MAWDWSWVFLVTVQRLAPWAMVSRRCEFLIRNVLRIRTRYLRNTVYCINMLDLKYLLFLQNCGFCTVIHCRPFTSVIYMQLIASSCHSFMTKCSSFKLRGYEHSQISLKLLCATGTGYLPMIRSNWIF